MRLAEDDHLILSLPKIISCPFRMYGPPPICKWIFASWSNKSAVMYPAPEHSLWP
jgi:hypothetical protein